MPIFSCIQDNYYLTVDSVTLNHTARRIGPRRYHWPLNIDLQLENPEQEYDTDDHLDSDYRDDEDE